MPNNIPIAVGDLVAADTINTWARGYFRKNTVKAVNGTTTATDLLNAEFTLPAGALATDKILRLTAWGKWKQNVATAKDVPAFRWCLGGTTMIDTNNFGANVAQQVNQYFGWRLTCEVQNLGATNSQQAYVCGELGMFGFITADVGNTFTTGNGIIAYVGAAGAGSSAMALISGGNTGLTIDTTASCAVELKVVNNSNNAQYDMQLLGALAEII